jgi:hypothetical protein
MLDHLGWTELLWRWSGEAIAHADALGLEVTPQMRASGWIGAPPASAADIATAQSRLERSLPRSYRSFLSITDGWPVMSFDFGQVRPVAELDWVANADPGLYEVVCADHGYEWPPDSDDGPPLMNRALLLGTGTDNFLYDTGRIGVDGEWATTCWTSWHPGGRRPAAVVSRGPGIALRQLRPLQRTRQRHPRRGHRPGRGRLPAIAARRPRRGVGHLQGPVLRQPTRRRT